MSLPAFPLHTPLVLGTYNLKKALGAARLLAPWQPAGHAGRFSAGDSVEETGDTFAANAGLKAGEQAFIWRLGAGRG